MADITRTLEILDTLIAFPTMSKDSNLALIDWVQNLLQTAGFEVTRLAAPSEPKAGLFARIGPNTPGGVCLSAHTDVVPVDGQDWTHEAFQLTQANARIYGRGTTDMKGFLASALALAERIAVRPLSAPLMLSISYDEEIGCVGIQHMIGDIKTRIDTPDIVIVGEPTSMQIATGHKGKTALSVTCHGEPGHSALAPNFVNAIHVAADFVHGIEGLQSRLAKGVSDPAYSVPYSTVHIGRISGGKALNIVPSSAHLDMEFRHLPQTPASEIKAEIDQIAQQISEKHTAITPISVKAVNAYPGLDTPLQNPAIALAERLTNGSSTTKVPFGTEAGFFAELGLNTVVIGPGDMVRDGHKPDEGLDLAQLAACDDMMDRIAKYLTK